MLVSHLRELCVVTAAPIFSRINEIRFTKGICKRGFKGLSGRFVDDLQRSVGLLQPLEVKLLKLCKKDAAIRLVVRRLALTTAVAVGKNDT